MSESSADGPTFETRLAAMDARLREIQAELLPEREPRAGWAGAERSAVRPSPPPVPEEPLPPPPRAAPPPPEPPPPPPPPPRAPRAPAIPQAPAGAPPPLQAVDLLGGLYGRLVASMRELLDGYETAL